MKRFILPKDPKQKRLLQLNSTKGEKNNRLNKNNNKIFDKSLIKVKMLLYIIVIIHNLIFRIGNLYIFFKFS